MHFKVKNRFFSFAVGLFMHDFQTSGICLLSSACGRRCTRTLLVGLFSLKGHRPRRQASSSPSKHVREADLASSTAPWARSTFWVSRSVFTGEM